MDVTIINFTLCLLYHFQMEQMIWHWIWYNMMGATSEAGSIHLSEEPEFTPFLWSSCCSIFSFLYSVL